MRRDAVGHEESPPVSRVHQSTAIRRATTIARHFARILLDDGEELQRSAVLRAIRHEVIRPDVVPIRRTLANARAIRKPQPAPFWLFLQHSEALSPPQPLDAFVIHRPAFPLQEPRDPSISIAPIGRG